MTTDEPQPIVTDSVAARAVEDDRAAERTPAAPGAPRHAETPRAGRTWTRVLARWPTVLAVAMTLASLPSGESDDDSFEGFGEALPFLALGYLFIAKVQRRGLSWPALVIGSISMTALRAVDVVSPVTVWVGGALLVLIWSVIDGHLRDSGLLKVQALGMAAFTVLATIGLVVDPDVGRYLVAAGWFLHGVWDLVHLWLDKVVARSFAEWCGVFDILVAAQIVLLA
jgi:hypothetical protein